ncbi:MAG: phage holin family protein [Actinobacteria bacterium]|nr:phage holin family protein [Actinomycetota bacterium]
MARAVPVPPEGEKPVEEKSIPELIRQIVRESSELIREEFQLLREELTATLRQLLIATALVMVGAIILVLGVAYLGATLILLLALAVTPWVSALIVTLAFLIAGGLIAYWGIRNFNRVKIAPRTVETLKEDAEWLRHPTRPGER